MIRPARPGDVAAIHRLIRDLADIYQVLDGDPGCRAIVLCSAGKNFCAGASLTGPGALGRGGDEDGPTSLYREAIRLFGAAKPVVAAVHRPIPRDAAHDGRAGHRTASPCERPGSHPGFTRVEGSLRAAVARID